MSFFGVGLLDRVGAYGIYYRQSRFNKLKAPRMIQSDTSEEVAKKQISILRAKTISHRFALTMTLSETMMNLSKRAIRRSHPDFSEEQVKAAFIELHYGKELADNYVRYLQELKK